MILARAYPLTFPGRKTVARIDSVSADARRR